MYLKLLSKSTQFILTNIFQAALACSTGKTFCMEGSSTNLNKDTPKMKLRTYDIKSKLSQIK